MHQSIADALVKKSKLQKWSNLNLQARCMKISQEFGIQISVSTLKKVYKMNGVAYRNV